MFLKVCGLTRAADVACAAEHGATAVGFVFWAGSPRCVSPEAARELIARVPPGVETVGVFVNETVHGIRDVVARSGVRIVQLHGDEPVSYVAQLDQPLVRALDVEAAQDSQWPEQVPILVDAADRVRRGGTGERVNWDRAASLARRRRMILAGGLTPDNVQAAIAAVRPFGVDVSSGVEDAPGIKSPEKVALFLERARHAFERLAG